MKITLRTIGLIVISASLLLITGCNTPSGMAIGGALGTGFGALFGWAYHRPAEGAMVGGALGAGIGGIVGELNEQQRAYLQEHSPETLETIQHNNSIAQQPPTASAQPSSPQPPATASAQDTPTPLTVDDIKALAAAGVKPDAIIQEIKQSNATYTPAQIEAAQQANPPVDSSVIAYMQNPT